MVESVTPGEQLCLNCGLCCDGTLFDGVQLEPDENAGKLKSLGLPVKVSRGKAPVTRFPQPCAALCTDRTCRLYQARPKQCRIFECGVYKDLHAGRTTLAAALRLVRSARRRADKIRRLIRELGETDDFRSLGERFHRLQEHMEHGSPDQADLAKFADLSLDVHRLKLQAHARFYTRPEPS
jgi:Fe-S-cluster containining protein